MGGQRLSLNGYAVTVNYMWPVGEMSSMIIVSMFVQFGVSPRKSISQDLLDIKSTILSYNQEYV